MATIQNGLDYRDFSDAMSAEVAKSEILPGKEHLFWFGTAGRLSAVKNQHLLIEAFADVAPRLPDAILVIAGTGELENMLKETARRRGVEGRVFFLGFRRDIPRLMRSLDVFLLPSRREGFGLVLVEAMASARPAIVSRVGGIPEVVGESGCAILVDPQDRSALAAAMLRLRLVPPAERELMGARGRERALGQFSAERMIREYENLYAAAFARWEKAQSGKQEA